MSNSSLPLKVTMLGTGTSTGIPVIGCECRVCTSVDPRDKRTRCSCFVEANGVNILIDAGPDLRTQALKAQIKRVDAVLITHHHFDHIAGLDDLRPFFFDNRSPIPCYAHPETAEALRSRFSYIFEERTYPGIANLEMYDITGPFTVKSRYQDNRQVEIIPFEVFHGKVPVLGFRIGRFAYITDTNYVPKSNYTLLEDLDTLVLDGLRHEPHPTHFSIKEAMEVACHLGPRRTFFTHMTHRLLHAEEEANLPEPFSFAYDGLSFEVP